MTHNSFVQRMFQALRRLFSDDAGQTLVLAAVMMPVLIGTVGMAIDTGYAFDYRNQMQSATDSAAMAGTRALRADATISASALANVVNVDAAQNGFVHGSNNVTISVCMPGVDVDCVTQYHYDAEDVAVKVVIHQPKPTFFSGILGRHSMDVSTKAVASASPTGMAKANIVILDDQCTSATFNANGGADVVISGRVWVNSCDQNAAKVTGGGDVVAADGVYLTCNSANICGGYTEGGGSSFFYTPKLNNGQIEDPLAELPVPTPTGPYYDDPNFAAGTLTLYPGIYNQGITLKGGTVTFEPGIYFVSTKPLSFSNGVEVLGDGVMFYVYNGGSLDVRNPTTTVKMTAPTSGTYRGIWYFQERTNLLDAKAVSGALMDVAGTFYIAAPGSTLAFDGNSNSGAGAAYTAFVVWRFTVSGGATFNGDFTSIGGPPLKSGPSLSE